MANGEQAEAVTTEPQPVETPKTEPQLMAEMETAVKSGDFKAVAKIAKEIAKMQADAEKVERDAKLAILDEVGKKVLTAIQKAIKPYIEDKSLDVADGVWFSWDFGDKSDSIRLLKSQPKARSSSGSGGGKQFDVSTNDLLAKHGMEVIDKETGQTFQQAWDASTDGNKRYSIRNKLLKIGGYRQ